MVTIYIDPATQLVSNTEFMVFTDQPVEKNDKVVIARSVFLPLAKIRVFGKPIAEGVCVGNGDEDNRSNKNPNTKKAWARYRTIRVEKIY